MNNVVLVGRLTKEAELKFMPNTGKANTRFILAVNRKYKADGQPEADFIPVVAWGKLAENIVNYTIKGSLVSVRGSIQTRSYDEKEGAKRYITEVVIQEITFLDSKYRTTLSGDDVVNE